MFGYVLARPVTVRASGGAKHVPAAAHFGQPAVRDVHIATFKETLHVRQALEAQDPGVPQTELIRTVPAPQLRQWRGYPSVLGRLARDGDEDIDAAVARFDGDGADHPVYPRSRTAADNDSEPFRH